MSQQKTIAVISRADAKGGGASRVADDIWRGLDRVQGFKVTRFAAELDPACSETHHPIAPRAPKVLKAVRKVLRRKGYVDHHPVEYPLLGSGIKNADIVHAHDITTAMSPQTLNLLAKSGKRVIWTLHDMSPITGGCIYPIGCNQWQTGCGNCVMLDQWPFASRHDKTKEMNERRLDVLREGRIELISPSQWLADKVMRQVPEVKVHVIPNGVDTDRFTPEGPAPYRSTEPSMLFIASHLRDMRKGGSYVADIRRWLDENNRRLELVMVGNGNRGEIVKQGPLTLRYLGRIDDAEDLAAAYRSVDALLLPTHADNFPLVMLEAMACGRAVFGFSTGGIGEAIDDSCGATRASGDIAGLLEAFFAAHDAQSLSQLGEAARQRALDRYTATQFIEAHRALYNGHLETKSAAVQPLPVGRRKFGFVVCYHKETPRINTDVFTSIHVGRALASKPIPQTIGDDTGDNISDKNRSYCELTALYWVWKNLDAEYYGLFHYRRVLDFAEKGKPFFFDFAESTKKEFGWDKDSVERFCKRYDVITGPRWNVHPFDVPSLPMTNYEFYAREHHQHDMDMMLQVVGERSPELLPYVEAYMAGKTCFYGNVFVMKREIFHNYSEWLFDILFEVEKRSDITGYDAYQGRVWGFLAERMMGAYIDYVQATAHARIGHLPMAYGIFDKSNMSLSQLRQIAKSANKTSVQAVAPETVPVVMIVRDGDAAQCGVTLRSAADKLEIGHKLQVHLIVNGDLSRGNQAKLRAVLPAPHELRFHEPLENEFSDYGLTSVLNGAVPPELLQIQDILPQDVPRAIYLTSGALVLDSLHKLHSTELGDAPFAACEGEGGMLQARRLNFPAGEGYVDAGVLLLNLETLRAEDLTQLYAEVIRDYQPVITQGAADVLNIAFRTRLKRLDLWWNVTDRFYHRNELDRKFSVQQASEAAAHPAIVQFSGLLRRPWEQRGRHPLTAIYWKKLAETPFAPSYGKIAKNVLRSKLRNVLHAIRP